MAAVAAPQAHVRHPSARLAPPPLRPGHVERPALVAQLDAAVEQALTVVRAPTGYGKTMLLARWACSAPATCAWASLSPAERIPSRLWPLLADAVAHAVDDVALSLRLQRVAAARSSAAQLRALVEALAAVDGDIVLVLDDVQLAGAPAERALARLLERVPENVHLVLATRGVPELGVAVLRARGELVELDDEDLRFSVDEAHAVIGPAAVRRDVAALVGRLEGWPAGIHLAALAAAGADRPVETLRSFSGGARLVADYLRQELLEAQPDDAHREFLLRTSVLPRLTPAAVEALLGASGAGRLLDDAVAHGAFLAPAEGGGHRFRQPVREFLQAELLRVDPGAVPGLRRRAASACERSGLVDEAIDQARAAGDARAAASIARRHALDLARAGRLRMLEHVVRASVGVELRRLESAASAEELLAAAERVARAALDVPTGQVRTLLRETAAAERAYALLLLDRCEEAHAAGSVVEIGPASAARAQLAAVGSLAATRLGLHVAAAPLARAAASAARAAGVASCRASALAHAAAGRERELEAAAAGSDASVRALALVLLAAEREPAAARTLLDASRRAASEIGGAPLLTALAADVERRLEPHERHAQPAAELSPAELRVLRLFASRLTQREIARELYLSPNTVKTHARVIYRKLGVDGRATAVRTARELNLV